MSKSNLAFYDHAKDALARSYPNEYQYFVKCLRISEVLRYNPESIDMGCVIINHHRAVELMDFYDSSSDRRLMSNAWFMELAGTEYMLELLQPTQVDSRLELFKLSTDAWVVEFNLRTQNSTIAANTGKPLLRYMNKYAMVGKFELTGNIDELENNITMFSLVSSDLSPQPSSKGI